MRTGQDDDGQATVGVHQGRAEDPLLGRAAAGAPAPACSFALERPSLTSVCAADLPLPPVGGLGGHEDVRGAVPVVLEADGAAGASLLFPRRPPTALGLTLRKPLPQIALFFFMEDTWHYFVHRLMHHR